MGQAGPMKSTGLGLNMTERDFQNKVVDLCKWLGLRIYHTYDSRRSQAGFPDLVIVGNDVIWVELKSETGKVSAHQREWLTHLKTVGQEVYVVRPSNFHLLETRLRELAGK